VVIGVFLLGFGCTEAMAATPPAKKVGSEEACLTTLKIKSNQSLLSEVRRLGVSLRDFPQVFEAHTPNTGVHRPLKAGGMGPGGAPLFWLDEDGVPFVDGRVFGTLQAVSIPSLSSPATVTVGRLVAFPPPSALTVIRQLIEADVIGTYVHLESMLCLREISGGVHVTGTHTYVTDSDNTDPLDFNVIIDDTGHIRVSQG
jgi:hypothetical protein